MPNIAIVGATRGLGRSLAEQYVKDSSNTVFGTGRKAAPKDSDPSIKWITGVDIGTPAAGDEVIKGLNDIKGSIDTLIVTAGFFGLETFDKPDWDAQVTMYTTSAIGPVFLVQKLVKAGLLAKDSKVILVSSESGSITLRHESEGGGNYGHHASKAALNMVNKLLSLDMKEQGIAVVSVHPGFMRTEMTKGVGFDKFWDEGGAVTPDVAAKSLIDWIETFDISKTGTYWAPRGAADIGTAEDTIGPKDKLPIPLQLPW
ncbi:NAD(P)-binding protein [Microthyrium microscopicum]|uniref:NAD(P)-binding protein n=1 Tax=Microthyrium microscopicum TaxID=703497 RepID=A0A6A6U149_9PEZI|nr:NAD(P)-binding protein [Microthyrium microscopicum]